MDVEIEKPHVHHNPTGKRWLDLTIPMTALFVSFVSIAIAWHHTIIMSELVHQNEKLVEANSLPYLAVYGSDLETDLKTPAFRLTVENQGVGPARIAEVFMTVNGHPVPDFNTLVDHCCAPGLLQAAKGGAKQYRGVRNGEVILSQLRDQMIRPGEKIDAVDWRITPQNKAVVDSLAAAFATSRFDVSVCFCSVFDDCWIRTDSGRQPVPVKQCPMAAVPYRQ
jgi:hypothetical protein